MKDLNPNFYKRKWEISYRKNKWNVNDKEILILAGTFIDVLIKLKEIMDNDIYTDFVIKEID